MRISESKPKLTKQVTSAARTYFKNPYVWLDDFEETLKSLGWEQTGIGSRSTIYSNPKKSYVLKVNNNPDLEYAKYVNLIKKYPNKHFPKISDLRRFRIGGKTYYIYLIEKLYHFPHKIGQKYIDALEIYLSSDLNAYSLNDLFHGKVPQMFNDPSLIEALNRMINFSDKFRIWFDLHENNIMHRKNGTLVITDPYS